MAAVRRKERVNGCSQGGGESEWLQSGGRRE